MSNVIKNNSGKLFYDDFSTPILNENFELSPSDLTRISLEDRSGFIRLKHGNEPIYLFIKNLEGLDNFVLDIKNDYKTSTPEDKGGLIIFESNDRKIELLKEYATPTATPLDYSFLRLIKDNRVYEAYTSENESNWNLVGTQYINILAPKYGICLFGIDGNFLDIDFVRAFKSNKINVGNLKEGMKVQLVDEFENVLAEQICNVGENEINLDCSHISFPLIGKFKIYTEANELIDGEYIELWGGDDFSFSITVNIFYEDEIIPLTENDFKFIGYMEGQYIERMLAIQNPFSTYIITGINIQILQYDGDNSYQNVQLALDNSGVPDTYQDSLSITQLNPNETKYFWMKVNRDITNINEDKLRYIIRVESNI